MSDVFDISSIKEVESAEVRIKHPVDGTPTGWVITLAGPEHPGRKAREMAKLRRMRKVIVKTGKLPDTDPEEDEADETDLLVACTLAWTGANVAYSPEAARKLYTDPATRWVRRQVKAALGEAETFTQASAQS